MVISSPVFTGTGWNGVQFLSGCRRLVEMSVCVSSDLLQRLRTRERERQRLHQRSHGASREARKSLSYDAAPFYLTPPPLAASSAASSQDTVVASDTGSVATSTDASATAGTDLAQRRQLGERLYPKVQSVQPVSSLLLVSLNSPPCRSRNRVSTPPGKFWKVLDCFLENSRTWKVLENHFGPGKFWNLKLKVLESLGKISSKVMHFSSGLNGKQVNKFI